MKWQNLLFIAIFLLGGVLAATFSLQLTLGVALMVVGYSELRKRGIELDDIDDILKEKIKELLDRDSSS